MSSELILRGAGSFLAFFGPSSSDDPNTGFVAFFLVAGALGFWKLNSSSESLTTKSSSSSLSEPSFSLSESNANFLAVAAARRAVFSLFESYVIANYNKYRRSELP